MENNIIPIHFSGRGVEYKGWAAPSPERHEDGYPMHYRVVLNEVFSANFWLNRGKWFADEPKMQALAVEVGNVLDSLPATHRGVAF